MGANIHGSWYKYVTMHESSQAHTYFAHQPMQSSTWYVYGSKVY